MTITLHTNGEFSLTAHSMPMCMCTGMKTVGEKAET
jgi:hypothetical protein